jgi:hypothetical protein
VVGGDVRDYYNQFANFEYINNYNSLFLILFFVIIVGLLLYGSELIEKKIDAISLQKKKDRY